METTLMRPKGQTGRYAENLLEKAGVTCIVILKTEDREVSLSVKDEIFPWKGINGIERYIAGLHKK
jgi:molybdate-binding protein